jgi:hypothetical protein
MGGQPHKNDKDGGVAKAKKARLESPFEHLRVKF